MKTLLPLYLPPQDGRWATVAGRSTDGLRVVVETADIPALAGAPVTLLGRVDLGYAVRPLADLLAEVAGWGTTGVHGVFLDHAPTTPFAIGPVAMAVRAAHRAGLAQVVVNPGTPPDPVYRDIGATLCVFDGPWDAYRSWSGHGALPGDGHLVHSVPRPELAEARSAVIARGAGFGLVTDRTAPTPYAGLPFGWSLTAGAAR